MLKALTIVVSLMTATSAIADSISLSAKHFDDKKTTNQVGYSAKYQTNLTKIDLVKLDGDIVLSTKQKTNNTGLGSRLELGATASAAGFYTRVAVGEKLTNNQSVSYYSIEPGYKVPLGPVTASIGYRYRDAFTNANGDQTHTLRLGANYKLTETTSISLKFDKVKGDNDQSVFTLGWSKKF